MQATKLQIFKTTSLQKYKIIIKPLNNSDINGPWLSGQKQKLHFQSVAFDKLYPHILSICSHS